MTSITHEIIPRSDDLNFTIFTFHASDTNRIIPQHWHQNGEFLFCSHGSLEVWLQGNHYVLKKNDAIFINPYVTHTTKSPCNNSILCIQIPLNLLKDLTEQKYGQEFIFNLNTVIKNTLTESDLLLLNNLTRLGDTNSRNIGDKLITQAYIFLLLTMLYDNYCENTADSGTISDIFLTNKIIDYINEHFKEKLSLKNIADYLGYSENYCSKLIKYSIGMNFHNFLETVRLNDAYEKIIYTHLNFEDIAIESGFNNYRNLYNVFYKNYKKSPSQIRKFYKSQSSINNNQDFYKNNI